MKFLKNLFAFLIPLLSMLITFSIFLLINNVVDNYKSRISKDYSIIIVANNPIEKDNITLVFKLYDNVSSKKDRIALEKKLIDTKKPRMQSGVKDRVKSIEDMIDELTNFLNEWIFHLDNSHII